jgi:general secretion pathway protein G
MKRLVFRIAVVMVLAIGLAIVVGIRAEWTRLNRARYTEARAQIAELQEELRQYHADNGFYPTTDQGLLALSWGTVDPGMVLPREPEPLRWPHDAWGNPYFYESDGNSYVLWSLGPQGFASRRDELIARSPKSPN